MRPQWLPALDSLRGLAALMVALYHVTWRTHFTGASIVRNSWAMVDLFFVLSGFVICHSYGHWKFDRSATARFLGVRFGRLYPLHLATLLAFGVIECVRAAIEAARPGTVVGKPFEVNTPLAFVSNLLLVHGLGLHRQATWNVPSWSISTEFYTYALFAAVCAVAAASRLRIILMSTVLAAGAAALMWTQVHGLEDTSHFAFFRCVLGFFAGVLAYEVWRRTAHARVTGRAAAVAALGCCFAVAYLPAGRPQLLLVPLFAILVFYCAGHVGASPAATPLLRLGAISYSVYMMHPLLIFGIETLLQHVFHVSRAAVYEVPPFAGDILLIAYIALLLTVASWTFTHIEDRFRRSAKVLFCPEKSAPLIRTT